jgi:nucleotide-binding universal stress UspA family protein
MIPIPQIKKILYTTDLTKNSTYAFHYAIELAQKHDARIVILHCVEEIPSSAYTQAAFFDAVKILRENKNQEKKQNIVKIKKGLQQFCQKVESQIGSPCVNLVSEVIVKEGHAAEEILNTADTKRCDVIVLGTHGKGWLKHAFLGSVAGSVLGRTRKPVFIVPLPSEKNSIKMGEL